MHFTTLSTATGPGVIPQPKPLPIVGNLFEIDPDAMIQSMMRLADKHGPIFQIVILGQKTIALNSQELVNEVCDETRFSKKVHSSLSELRNLVGDGLFTAYGDEPNWERAHRLLMPAFGPLGVRGMFDRMLDIAVQMMTRWERFGDAEIDVSDNMTRLTLDTLALCAFDYRFNSFYRDELHPFVAAMAGSLTEASARDRRPPFISHAMLRTRRRYEADIKTMQGLADDLLTARRAEATGPTRGDLLDKMLHGRDPVTGERLGDENIRHQLVTFLIAGHETTSGLLSFAIYLLMRNPEVMDRARRSVDEVLGSATPRMEDLAGLRYVEQVLMESLRLWPTAPAFAVTPHEPTTIGDGYAVTPGDELLVLLPSLHRDRAVWGDDAELFRPERFAPGVAESLPPNAWKPFGNGRRACIGRGFAMQEAQLVLAMVLQRFDLAAADPGYQLKISETLTIKPVQFRVRAKRRPPGRTLAGEQAVLPPRAGPCFPPDAPRGIETPLLLLYGSNSGSSQTFAQTLASQGASHGYATTSAPLDAYAGRLPTDGAIIIVAASYEGLPPDNAKRFTAWLNGLAPDALKGVRYAVFGCGNRQWARTYQAVPKQLDSGMSAAGASRIRARGEADASADFSGGFEGWCDTLWQDLAAALGIERAEAGEAPLLRIEIVPFARQMHLGQPDLRDGTVVVNHELVDMSSPIARSKRHLEIRLPPEMSFAAGDYLAVLPRNPPAAIARALRYFDLEADSQVVIRGPSALPVDRQMSIGDLLGDYIEFGQPATRRQVAQLGEAAGCPPEKAALSALAGPEAYEAEVVAKRVSLLDLLERYPSTRITLAQFLSWLPQTRSRQYSISSSPLADASACSLTVAVLDRPALSGDARYRGLASTYLAALEPGARVTVAVRPARSGFHLPSPDTPMIMACAGSGIAPFRGFLQERSIELARGIRVARSILFFGCMHPDVDWPYREELLAWQAEGLVDLRMAFSRNPPNTKCYVQDRILQDRNLITKIWSEGGSVYVCGRAGTMVPPVRAAFAQILNCDDDEGPPCPGDTKGSLEETGRYLVDAFA